MGWTKRSAPRRPVAGRTPSSCLRCSRHAELLATGRAGQRAAAMTYPSRPSAPIRRHSTPVPPLPDYGRIRRPARADEHLPVAAGYGYDDRAAPSYAPDDRFYDAPPPYRDDDAGYAAHDHDDRYDHPGY